MRVDRVEHLIPDNKHTVIEYVTVADGTRGRMTVRYRDPALDNQVVEQSRIFIDTDLWVRDPNELWTHLRDDELQMPMIFTPQDYARFLTHARDVAEKGDGHYTAVVDKAKLSEGAGAAVRDRMKTTLSPRVTKLPFEVWLDGDGRPRKISLTIRSAGGANVDLATEFLEIGVDDPIEPPPADTVVEEGP